MPNRTEFYVLLQNNNSSSNFLSKHSCLVIPWLNFVNETTRSCVIYFYLVRHPASILWHLRMNSKNHMFSSTIDSQSSNSDRKTSLNLTCLYFFFNCFVELFSSQEFAKFQREKLNSSLSALFRFSFKKWLKRVFISYSQITI